MCLIGFTLDPNSASPLVLASNRDEFFSRPTQAPHWWADEPGIFGGRDKSAGGTWLALRRLPAQPEVQRFRLVAITNFRDLAEAPTDAISRGAIVTRILRAAEATPDALHALRNELHRYAGFNLLAFEWTVVQADSQRVPKIEAWHLSNRGNFEGQVVPVSNGTHGLSNGSFDEPWPKSITLIDTLRQDDSTAELLACLTGEQKIADTDLPATGVPGPFEKALAQTFIRPLAPGPEALADYGTRSSSIIKLASSGEINYRHWTWDTGHPQAQAQNQYAMSWHPA